MINFIPLEAKHLQAVREIYNEYVAHTTVSFDLDPASLEKMKELTQHHDARYCAYVILDQHQLVGYVLLSPFIKKHSCQRTAEVTIYLHPQYKAKGIGRQALQFIEARALELSFHTLIAVICTENEASMRLFAGQGYQLKGILSEVAYKFDRFLDVAYMQKNL